MIWFTNDCVNYISVKHIIRIIKLEIIILIINGQIDRHNETKCFLQKIILIYSFLL